MENQELNTDHYGYRIEGNYQATSYKISSKDMVYVLTISDDYSHIHGVKTEKDETIDQNDIRGKLLNPKEIKVLIDHLNSEVFFSETLPDYLTKRIDFNANEENLLKLDDVSEISFYSEREQQQYDFIRYSLSGYWGLSTKEMTVTIHDDNSVSGNSIKYGQFFNNSALENLELVNYLVDNKLNIKPIDSLVFDYLNQKNIKEQTPVVKTEEQMNRENEIRKKREEYVKPIHKVIDLNVGAEHSFNSKEIADLFIKKNYNFDDYNKMLESYSDFVREEYEQLEEITMNNLESTHLGIASTDQCGGDEKIYYDIDVAYDLERNVLSYCLFNEFAVATYEIETSLLSLSKDLDENDFGMWIADDFGFNLDKISYLIGMKANDWLNESVLEFYIDEVRNNDLNVSFELELNDEEIKLNKEELKENITDECREFKSELIERAVHSVDNQQSPLMDWVQKVVRLTADYLLEDPQEVLPEYPSDLLNGFYKFGNNFSDGYPLGEWLIAFEKELNDPSIRELSSEHDLWLGTSDLEVFQLELTIVLADKIGFDFYHREQQKMSGSDADKEMNNLSFSSANKVKI